MDTVSFFGAAAAVVIAAIWLIRQLDRSSAERKRKKEIYNQNRTAANHHQHTGHKLVHSHSAERMQSGDDIWKASRLKVNESHWKGDAFVANRILTDAERKNEEKDIPAGSGIPTIEYTPEEPRGRRDSPGASKAAIKRS
jgi:hypothetical protein